LAVISKSNHRVAPSAGSNRRDLESAKRQLAGDFIGGAVTSTKSRSQETGRRMTFGHLVIWSSGHFDLVNQTIQ